MLQAQAVEPVSKSNPSTISDLVWSQEKERLRLIAKTQPIGGFSVTTPVVEGKRKRRRRVRHLAPDSSRMVDASHLVARLARLPRILSHADQMAERLAKLALSSAPPSPLVGEGPGVRGNVRHVSHSPPHPKPFSPLGGEGLFPTISVSLARTPPPNPLWFKPLRSWYPPDDLWFSTEDEDERGDLTWLHFKACETLTATGYAPGPAEGTCLPDLTRYEPPGPPQIRAT